MRVEVGRIPMRSKSHKAALPLSLSKRIGYPALLNYTVKAAHSEVGQGGLRGVGDVICEREVRGGGGGYLDLVTGNGAFVWRHAAMHASDRRALLGQSCPG